MLVLLRHNRQKSTSMSAKAKANSELRVQLQHPMNAVLYWCGTQNGIKDTPWLNTGETELYTIQGT